MDMPENGEVNTRPVQRTRRHVHKRIGPYSHFGAVALLDGRSREAQFIRSYEKMLLEHLGANPSAVQRALVTRASRLALYCEMFDERGIHEGGLSERDSRQYMMWSNALQRLLLQLGVKAPDEKPGFSDPNSHRGSVGLADLMTEPSTLAVADEVSDAEATK
jgi:hypothetical protein